MAWFITRHAMSRMIDMKVERDQVTDTLNDPETDYPSREGCRVATRDNLAVVYKDEVVVTVMWNGGEWERGRASAKTEKRKLAHRSKKGVGG